MKGLRSHLLNLIFYTYFLAKTDRKLAKSLSEIHQLIIIKDARGSNDLIRKVMINLSSFFGVNLKKEKFFVETNKEDLFDVLILRINKLHKKGQTYWLNDVFKQLENYAYSSVLKTCDEPKHFKLLLTQLRNEHIK